MPADPKRAPAPAGTRSEKAPGSREIAAPAGLVDGVLNQALVMVGAIGFDGSLQAANRAAEELLGWSREELLGRPYLDLIHPDDAGAVARQMAEIRAGSGSAQFETRVRRHDGAYRSLLVNATADPDARLFYAIAVDVTARRLVEASLDASERRWAKLFELTVEALMVVDPGRDKVIDANPAACRLLGYPKEKLLATPVTALFLQEPWSVEVMVRRAFRTGSAFVERFSYRRASGELRPGEVSVSVFDHEGRRCLLANVRDIGARLQEAEAAERLAAVFNCSVDALITVDLDGRVTAWNRAAEDMFGYPAAAVLYGRVESLVVPADQLPEQRRQVARARAGEQVRDWRTRFRRADGTSFPAGVSFSLLRTPAGEPLGLTVLVRDLTSIAAVEDSLRNSEERFQGLVEQVPAGIFLADADGHYVYANDTLARIAGQGSACLRADGWQQHIHPSDRARVLAEWEDIVARGVDWSGQYRVVRPDGSQRLVSVSARPVRTDGGAVSGFIGTYVDTTDQERLAELTRRDARYRWLTGVLTQMPSAVMILRGSDLVVSLANPAATRMADHDPVGLPLRVAFPERTFAPMVELAENAYRASAMGETSPAAVVLDSGPGGEARSYAVCCGRLAGPEGDTEGVISVAVDVTDVVRARRQAEDLLDRARRALDEAEAANLRLRVAHELGTSLSEALRPAEVAERTVACVTAALGSSAWFASMNEGKTALELLHCRGYAPDMVDRFSTVDLDAALPLPAAARRREPLWLATPADIARAFPALADIDPDAGAMAALPLISGGEVLGALGLSFPPGSSLPPPKREFLTVVARLAGQALGRTRSHTS